MKAAHRIIVWALLLTASGFPAWAFAATATQHASPATQALLHHQLLILALWVLVSAFLRRIDWRNPHPLQRRYLQPKHPAGVIDWCLQTCYFHPADCAIARLSFQPERQEDAQLKPARTRRLGRNCLAVDKARKW